MRLLDKALLHWRFRLALPWVPEGGTVLDVGCHQGEFFRCLGQRLRAGVGYDPLAAPQANARFRLVAERFPVPSPFSDASFDIVVLLATLEHIRDKAPLPKELYRLLRAEGRAILTVPSPRIDALVDLLRLLRLADGMSIKGAHGFVPSAVEPLFLNSGFTLERRNRFQLGLNNLFVFRKPAGPDAELRS